MVKFLYGIYFERHKSGTNNRENNFTLLTTITVSKNPKNKLDLMQKHEQI
jgi:hypothetical protein